MKKLTGKALHRRIMKGTATRAMIVRGINEKLDARRAAREVACQHEDFEEWMNGSRKCKGCGLVAEGKEA